MKSIFAIRCVLLLIILLGASNVPSMASDGPLSPDQIRFFESNIRPVLVKECYGCHSNQVGQVRGGFWLDSAEGTLAGGDSGAAIVPGDPESSLLWQAINHTEMAMPPRKKLSDEILRDFRIWIEMGAPDPRTSQSTSIQQAISAEEIERGRGFWSFRKPVSLPVPHQISDWAESPIDRFIYSKLDENRLTPAEDADPHIMLRRLTMDLIGLPPTPQQTETFLRMWHKSRQKAVSEIVDSLLAMPQFGERWGRHWLDVARFAESTGREVNMTLPHAWRYRDYVIDAFNNDKPFDQFVQEQLAGDLLPSNSDRDRNEKLIATSFLAMGPKSLNQGNARQFAWDQIDEQIDVTTRVFLGVSVACARCHDHKFDPIPQSDYYALAGIFRSTSTHFGTPETRQNKHATDLIQLPIADAVSFQSPVSESQLQEWQSKFDEKQEEIRELNIARRKARLKPQTDVRSLNVQLAQATVDGSVLRSKLESYDSQGNPRALSMGVREGKPEDARLLERGELNQPAQVIPRGFPSLLCSQPVHFRKGTTGRLELARWIGSDQNSLTARVMVNRVWQHLMGAAIVSTTEDFGSSGTLPSHPELLDYLALQFADGDWSVKNLIRMIANSRTYRMSSQFDQAKFQIDPENKYRWRMEQKRLEAEVIRDSMLFASGELDLERPHGSIVALAGTAQLRGANLVSLQPNESSDAMGKNAPQMEDDGLRVRLPNRDQTLQVSAIDQPVTYRSVYLPIVRDSLPRSLDVLDFAEPSLIIGTRESSHSADQGLYFLNNLFVHGQAKAMAGRLLAMPISNSERLELAFEMAYSRPATASEISVASDFLKNYQASEDEDEMRSHSRRVGQNKAARHRRQLVRQESEDQLLRWASLCQAIFASAEFRYVN